MEMLPRPSRPRAVQSKLWQNWLCGSIGRSLGTRFGDHVYEECLMDPRFSSPYRPNHGSVGCYPAGPAAFLKGILTSAARVEPGLGVPVGLVPEVAVHGLDHMDRR